MTQKNLIRSLVVQGLPWDSISLIKYRKNKLNYSPLKIRGIVVSLHIYQVSIVINFIIKIKCISIKATIST